MPWQWLFLASANSQPWQRLSYFSRKDRGDCLSSGEKWNKKSRRYPLTKSKSSEKLSGSGRYALFSPRHQSRDLIKRNRLSRYIRCIARQAKMQSATVPPIPAPAIVKEKGVSPPKRKSARELHPSTGASSRHLRQSAVSVRICSSSISLRSRSQCLIPSLPVKIPLSNHPGNRLSICKLQRYLA